MRRLALAAAEIDAVAPGRLAESRDAEAVGNFVRSGRKSHKEDHDGEEEDLDGQSKNGRFAMRHVDSSLTCWAVLGEGCDSL